MGHRACALYRAHYSSTAREVFRREKVSASVVSFMAHPACTLIAILAIRIAIRDCNLYCSPDWQHPLLEFLVI
jgi:hypothetical protein